ncbi:MAG: DNA polymerase/3'-5' exonuclease PolX [Sphingomonadaceae bacterium]
MRNAEVAAFLNEIADLLELKGDSRFRVGAYRTAASRIENLTEDVDDLWATGHLQDVPGFGESIAAKVGEFLETGRSAYLESLRKEVAPGLRELLKVPGIGPARAQTIYRHLGIRSLSELEAAAREHRLRELPGIREKTEEKILREVERLQQRTHRIPLGVALPAAEELARLLSQNPLVDRVEPAGSLRRMKETIGDIDLLASSEQPARVTREFAKLPIVKEVLAIGPTKASVLTKDNLQVDLRVVKPEEFGAALQYFTGNKEHNIVLRDIAIRHGWKLNEYGLFDESTGRRLAGKEECDIYRALGLECMPPELRENRGEIEAAANGTLPHLIEQKDLRGDLQVHSDWSDGTDTLEEMAEACRQMGYQYVAITDHSQGLGVARGLSPERLEQKLREVDELNRRMAPFRILKAAEVDIRGDGHLDYPDEILARLEIVVAAVHSLFEQSRQRMTDRILRAFENPYLDILAHPTGRLLNKRSGYPVDLERVLQAAAERGIALEINASPDRLDLDDVWARRAKELGVLLSIDTDAHSAGNLNSIRYGIAVARRGWLEARDVLNTLPLEQMLARLRRNRPLRRAA